MTLGLAESQEFREIHTRLVHNHKLGVVEVPNDAEARYSQDNRRVSRLVYRYKLINGVRK